MRKMKRMVSILMIVTMLLSLAACGKKDEGSSEDGKKRTQAETVTPTGTQAEPTETPTPEPTATPTPTAVPTVAPWPEAGCKIDLPTRELYHYDMDLTLNPEKKTIGGHVVFEFYNDTEDIWDKLCFRDYPSLFTNPKAVGYEDDRVINGAMTEISGIIDGRDGSSVSFSREEDVSVLWMNIKTPLAPGEKMTLTYDFTATIPHVGDRYGYWEDVYCITNFYPILAEYDRDGWAKSPFYGCGECFYSEVMNYDVRITVPKDFLIASTGTESGKKENGENVTFSFDAPYVRDFVFCASNTFSVQETTHNGVHVNMMYPKSYDELEYMAGAVESTLKCAGDSLAAFGEALGQYPYKELDIVISPLEAGGMEYPNLIIITDNLLQPVGVLSEDESQIEMSYGMLDDCVAHEIGHQWFMGIVGSNSGEQPWQDESLTSYLEIVYAEYLGKTDWVRRRYGAQLFDFSDPTRIRSSIEGERIPINNAHYEYENDTHYIGSVYDAGRVIFFQMEEILGHDEFMAILREYVRRNAFKNAMPEDFFTVLYERAGKDNAKLNALLDNCFDLSRLRFEE